MPAMVLPAMVRRHPLACGSALVAGAFLLAWSAATTSYIVFHDDALRLLKSRAHSQAEAYQRQIATLQASLDEQHSRLAVERRRTSAAIEQLRQRQIAIEARHGILSDLMNAAPDRPRPPRSGERSSMAAPPAVPRAPSDTVILGAIDLREALTEPSPGTPALPGAAPVGSDLAVLGTTFDRLEREQAGALDMLEETLERRDRRIRTVLAELGIAAPVRSGGVPVQAAAAGGPFVPVSAAGDAFDRKSGRARDLLADVARLKAKLDTVPLRRPVAGSIETTSGFGVRVDPFLGRAAFHTGIDFRGETGDPARATAAGTVTAAGRDGGYGLMVEIDHGGGLATRYAHLSAISVSVGDRVTAGGVVGRVGSTGRSTGPHLHYETRIKGEPVDPQRFLRAGIRLGEVI